MSQVSNQETQNQDQSASELIAKMEAMPSREPVEIGVECFSLRKGSRQDAVMRMSGILDVKAGYIEFPLKRPFYVVDVMLTGADGAPKPKLKLEFFDLVEDKFVPAKAMNGDEQVAFRIDRLITGFRIASDAWINKKESLKEIGAYGYSIDDFSELNAYLGSVESQKSDVENALKRELAQIQKDRSALEAAQADFNTRMKKAEDDLGREREQQEIALATEKKTHEVALAEITKQVSTEKDALNTLKAESIATRAVVETLSTEKTQLEITNNSLQGAIQVAEKREHDLEQEAIAKTAEITSQSELLGKLKDDIRTLNNEKSFFAEDMKHFTQHARKTIIIYLAVSAIAVAAGIYVVWEMLQGMGAAFDTYVSSKGTLSMGNLFLGLLPKVVGEISALIFVYYFTRTFIQEAMSLGRRRLRLSEISILSRDVTESAFQGSALPEEQRDAVRLAMRMYFVRRYLIGEYDAKSQTDSDGVLPEVPPTLVTQAVKWLPGAQKFLSLASATPSVKAEVKVDAQIVKDKKAGE